MNVPFSLNIPLFVVLVIESVNRRRRCRRFSSLIWSVFRSVVNVVLVCYLRRKKRISWIKVK